jgi:hypothetical protein
MRALAIAMRRHRNLASYEIYNEENVAQWWDGSFASYNDALKRGADAVREVAPRTQVLLGGMVYPDYAWVQHVCVDGHNGPRIDVVPFHAYPETWTPPDVDLERYLGPRFGAGFVRTVDSSCGRKPIWINETGYATVAGRSEHDQADWWARAIAMFTAEPRIEHIGVYEIKDLDPKREAIGDTPNYHIGITRADRSKKLAFHTVRMMVALFDAPLVVENALPMPPSGDLFVYAFRRGDGRQIVAAWAKSTDRTVDITVTHVAATAVEHHLDGSVTSYPSVDGRTLARVELHPGTTRIFELRP